ncbi:MAG: SDR family oxidoreductase [Acidimicrobiales bacterium]
MARRSMSGKVVVITGGSAGVGRAAAVAFGARGAKVAVLSRGEHGLAGTVAEVEEAGGEGRGYAVDVADAGALEHAAKSVEDEMGPIDVWVNDAMTSVFSPFVDVAPEEFRRVTEVAYLGYVYGTQVALRRMLPRDRGVIVQVGSALAYRSIPLQSAYCGAKHAIAGFTQSVRTELLHERSRVKVSIVHMPAVNTPQFDWSLNRLPRRPQPVPPIYQPEVAARAIVHMASHPRREMWVGGTTAATILANKVLPGLLDHYLGRTGYSSQQGGEPAQRDQEPNLWAPVDGDPGAHGRFDARSHGRSAELWLSLHRGAAATAVAATAVLAASAIEPLRRPGR